MVTKRLLIVNAHTGQETHVEAAEGATPRDVLGQLGYDADRYQLARVRDRERLLPSCDLTRAAGDGERLIALMRIEVGGHGHGRRA